MITQHFPHHTYSPAVLLASYFSKELIMATSKDVRLLLFIGYQY